LWLAASDCCGKKRHKYGKKRQNETSGQGKAKGVLYENGLVERIPSEKREIARNTDIWL